MYSLAVVDAIQTIVTILGGCCVMLLGLLIRGYFANNRAIRQIEANLRKAEESEKMATNRLADISKKHEFLVAKYGQDIKRKEEEVVSLHSKIKELSGDIAARDADSSSMCGSDRQN